MNLFSQNLSLININSLIFITSNLVQNNVIKLVDIFV